MSKADPVVLDVKTLQETSTYCLYPCWQLPAGLLGHHCRECVVTSHYQIISWRNVYWWYFWLVHWSWVRLQVSRQWLTVCQRNWFILTLGLRSEAFYYSFLFVIFGCLCYLRSHKECSRNCVAFICWLTVLAYLWSVWIRAYQPRVLLIMTCLG